MRIIDSMIKRWLPLTLLLGACSTGPKPEWSSINRYIDSNYPAVQNISVDQLQQMLGDTSKGPILLDARQQSEFDVSHIPGAILVESRLSLGERLTEEHAGTPERPIVVYCSVGVRSANLSQQLQEEGFDEVYNLRGSIFDWAEHALPLENAEGSTQTVHPYNKEWGQLLERKRWSFGADADAGS